MGEMPTPSVSGPQPFQVDDSDDQADHTTDDASWIPEVILARRRIRADAGAEAVASLRAAVPTLPPATCAAIVAATDALRMRSAAAAVPLQSHTSTHLLVPRPNLAVAEREQLALSKFAAIARGEHIPRAGR